MTSEFISATDTAKMIRQALKEAFPDIKFSVKTSKYAGGASIRVCWIDGPNNAQVEAVAGRFEGSYFDGQIDYKGSNYHMIDGKPVHFGADFLFFNRDYSAKAIERGIERVYNKFAGNFKRDGIEKPTVEDYQFGRLHRVQLSGLHHNGMQSVQAEIAEVLHKHSDRLKVNKSATAAKVFQTHTDGYGQNAFDAHAASTLH